jgi:carboxymethylenebutenolidase
MAGRMIDIAASDGNTFSGYYSPPAGGSGPGILMIQEMFGLNSTFRGVCDRFAGEGYAVLAPDMFWRTEPNFQADLTSQDDFQKAFGFYQGVDYEAGVGTMSSALDVLKAQPECADKVACIGFCMGGTFSYLAASRFEIDAGIAYYGTQIHPYLNELDNIDCPLLLHFGETDDTFPAEERIGVEAAVKDRAGMTAHVYEAGHAFANPNLPYYVEAAAETAHERSFALLSGLK